MEIWIGEEADIDVGWQAAVAALEERFAGAEVGRKADGEAKS